MLFEKNRTLQKWHMIIAPLEIDKYGTDKNDTPCKEMPKIYLPWVELVDF